MSETTSPPPGAFCWMDLAAADAARARDFYTALLGWQARDQALHGGLITCFAAHGHDIASMYQLRRRELAGGVPSHWTPYVAVADVAAAAAAAERLGGRVVVRPFPVEGIARISLIEDPVGALLGLYEPGTETADELR